MIKPFPGYVLIEPTEDESKTTGGLYLPETSKDKPSKGKVITFNKIRIWDKDICKDWCIDKISQLKIGQTVIYKKWTNQEVSHEGKEYLLVAFSELLAVIE